MSAALERPWPAHLMLRVDDPTADLGALDASTTRLYFSLTRRKSDLWTAELISR